ncbi:MAG TPA: prepilin-type N-terminal cleavage/methylation domain-containing protein [Acidimicrobiales bacterium]|jgi:type IV pilus assembly protein PilA|nr:prepilin-type N-terminal cleavage/methylation domain-containing protein [Acidimicrobiales bacterium]
MLSTMKARLTGRREDEDGFTLIELMVVVLIIAILIAIAIPTFLGARQKAQDRAAQSNLRNALTAAKTAYVDTQDYTTAASQLASIEPSLTYASGTASTGQSNISVFAPSATEVDLAAKSQSGTCFFLKDTTTGGTSYAKDNSSCAASTPSTGTYDADSSKGW